MPNYAAIADEINADPLSRGYSAMSDQEVADSLNVVNRSVPVEEVPSSALIEATTTSDWTGVGATDREKYTQMITGGSINPSGPNTQSHIADIFGDPSGTLANVVALASRAVSRAEEVGLGEVTFPDVNIARALNR